MPWYKLRSGTPWHGSKPPYLGAPEISEPGSEPVDPEPVAASKQSEDAEPKKAAKKK